MATSPSQYYSDQFLQPYIYPDLARTESVRIAPSLTIARGTVLGELTATPGVYKPYASGNTDGSQVAKAIAKYDMVTDANGNITLSATAGTTSGQFGESLLSVGVWMKGAFNTTELTGLDSGALTTLGHLIQGVLASGVIEIG